MIIRCERCATHYDLDESLLAPEGSSVQCARCQAVFIARPPGHPAPAAGKAAAPPAPPPAPPPSASARPGEPPRTARPGPAIYRPPQPPPAPAAPARGRGGRAPTRDAVSAMDARLRSMARWKLAAMPLGALLVLLLAYVGWSIWQRRPDPETQRQRAEAMALIAQDDAAALARAVELLDAIQLGHHASGGAAGERGLARALLAAALDEEIEPAAELLAAASAEKARLEREQPPGFEDAQRALAMEVARLEVELAPKRKKLEALRAQAADELRALAAEPKGSPRAARGQAVLGVLDDSDEEVQRAGDRLRQAGPDPWADLAQLWLAVRKDGSARDQAIPELATLSTNHPELVRARMVLARALAAVGRREEALSAVGRLLAANPRHERAQRLRAQLAQPQVVRPAPPPVREAPPPAAQPRVLQPRVAPAVVAPPSATPVAPPSAGNVLPESPPPGPPDFEPPLPLPPPPQPRPQPPPPPPKPAEPRPQPESNGG